jgi:alanine racemase
MRNSVGRRGDDATAQATNADRATWATMSSDPDPMNPAEALAGGRLTVDLGALADNWRTIAGRVSARTRTAAVVKGDGYGIGLAAAGRALAKAGCTTFFVATAEEGLQLRRALPAATIYVLGGFISAAAAAFRDNNLAPVLNSPADIDEWIAARRDGIASGAALHVDTGMNRLGLTAAEAFALAGDHGRVAALGLTLVMSHLACADTPAHLLNARQLAAFRAVTAAFPGVPASLANSAGVALGADYHFDLVRPGIALYGAAPGEAIPALRPVATAEARILQVREMAAGDTVGYGATETRTKPARLAILAAGYADGYHRAASSRDGRPGARVFVRGRFAPLVGRVSMDLMTVDVSDVAGVRRGDWAELFGPNVPVDEVAAHAGTIGYELLTALGRRYARRYVG